MMYDPLKRLERIEEIEDLMETILNDIRNKENEYKLLKVEKKMLYNQHNALERYYENHEIEKIKRREYHRRKYLERTSTESNNDNNK